MVAVCKGLVWQCVAGGMFSGSEMVVPAYFVLFTETLDDMACGGPLKAIDGLPCHHVKCTF
ncbi:hypothetical protein COLO4_35528 [Corchorus olitorius]|uniref:Uncharacterized protein n=1 Tax=Corchorus olitorius TaxID=93759 RepID=A0A1R3GFR5_9ROSI|nr:hypothetical protein COLO4_35528 [Corchorus olitorius]